ncbi:MAG: hypothetical protein JXR60_12205 [Bacteroidales bacterium]|nr:hypothetical protein [Bacteroidales bacterium]
MKNIFQVITEKLTNQQATDLLTSRNLPSVKYVDLYKGQYLSPELFDVMPLPAVLMGWSINHEDETATVNLHLVYEQVQDTSNKSLSQDAALKFFDYLNSIHELVNEAESENTGKLEAISFEPIQLDRVGIAHMLNYKCAYQDILDKVDPYIWSDGEAEVEFDKHIVKDFNFED